MVSAETVFPPAQGGEEIAGSLVVRQVISLARFARVAWRPPGWEREKWSLD